MPPSSPRKTTFFKSGVRVDLTSLAQKAASVPAATQEWIFFVLLIGFGTLVSLFPMHSWAAPAYALTAARFPA